ncbi:MAG: spermidine synthase [Planctomycetota bacterium]
MAGSEVGADLWVTEYITPWDVYSHGVTRVLAAATTEWQSMQIVETGAFGLGLVLDGKWQSCTGDEFMYHEPLVQPACVLLAMAGRAPRTALILGGGEGATLREVLRWSSIERCAMVDIDGEVVEACREHMEPMHRGAFDDPRADVVIGDALKYIEDPSNTPEGGWDLIISDLSDPIEDGPSFMLFTKEYFADLKRCLAPHGILVVQSGPTSPPELHLHARLRRTLRDVFANGSSMTSAVSTYPAPWSFILASDAPLPEVGSAPDAARVDAALAEHTRPFGGSGLKMFDGAALAGLLGVPKHLRDAIDAADVVYTKDAPPRFFGSGRLG